MVLNDVADLATLDPAVDILLAWRDDVLSVPIPTMDGLVEQACTVLTQAPPASRQTVLEGQK